MTLRVLDLFSGIGAYALGLERAGMKVVAFCECEEFPRRVLRKHWPDVPIYEDVRTLTADTLRRDGIAVDVIVGGWPCQDISLAGSGIGLDGERSGLWSEIARLAGELRPQFLILENSSNLLNSSPEGEPPGRDFGRVLGDLASIGYDAEWHCLSAAAFDAPHIRDRVWIVAHRGGDVAHDAWHGEERTSAAAGPERERAGASSQPLADANAPRNGRKPRRPRHAAQSAQRRQSDRAYVNAHVSDADGAGSQIRPEDSGRIAGPLADDAWRAAERSRALPHPHGFPSFGAAVARRERHTWEPEPDVVRVVHGVADRVDRIHGLGNCNPPIIPETIARAVIESTVLKSDGSSPSTEQGK